MASELLLQLRRRLQDDKYNVPAFVISCLDSYATDCLLEIQNGYLRTTILNGHSTSTELNLNLGSHLFATLGRTVTEIEKNHSKTYRVTPGNDFVEGHPSLDLEPVARLDIREGVTLHHRRFSDEELIQFISDAAKRHNPGYNLKNIPANESNLVLSLAHSDALKYMASDASKRMGIDVTVETLLSLAKSFEESYREDRKRVAKALSPIRSDDDGIREGDVVVGDFVRQSLRTGFMAPSPANIRANPPQMDHPRDRDIEDFGIHVRWRRSHHPHVHALEVWRDTRPDVMRTREDEVFQSTSKLAWSSNRTGDRTGFGRLSPSPLMEKESWGTKSEAGNLITGFFDGFSVPAVGVPFPEDPMALEPETTYYYRMYLVDRNGEWVASDVVSAMTLRARALFSRDPLIPVLSVETGPVAGGTAITIKGTGFTQNTPTIKIGSKACTSVVIVDDSTITCVSPPLHQFAPKKQDVVLESNTGLRDIVIEGWTYT